MSAAPYDAKNADSFDAVTYSLNEALKKLERDLSLPVNVTSLAKLASVHRNTIYHREWPVAELKRIKAGREQQKKDQAIAKANTKTPEQLLEQSRLEIVYWFTQLEEARVSVSSLTATTKQTAQARDYYMAEYKKSQETISKLNIEISKLQSAMAILEDELMKSKLSAEDVSATTGERG
ncbi:hypothetical protein [Pseudomonas sp. RIT-To-2]|uniref:hypothetical protein n=1 Tax=Pseudomonas sp. RIT-To-2 TaxID=3462541 RepID=UPI002413011E